MALSLVKEFKKLLDALQTLRTSAWRSSVKISELQIRRTKIVDMSPEAIAARLEELDQLYQLSMSLLTAQPVQPSDSSGLKSAGTSFPRPKKQ